MTIATLVGVAIVTANIAQKGNRGNGTPGDPPDPAQQTGTTGVSPVEDITNTLHFSSIEVSSNGTITLTAAWPTNFLTADQTLDVLGKENLCDETWTWLTNGVVTAGSDPYSPLSCLVTRTVKISDSDENGNVTNQLWISRSSLMSDSVCQVSFGKTLTTNVSAVATNGTLYAIVTRDLNRNGIYDEGVDISSAISFGHEANSAAGGSSGILIGDCGSDGVPDSEEIAAGTDPSNRLDYRFNLDLTVGGVFTTSNSLTAVVLVDGVAATTPCVVTGRSFACSLTNLYPHTGSGVVVRFWDDVDQNGIRDAGEKTADQRIVADGTNTVVYCRLPMGQFDADNDGMPDYWELQNGLSPLDPTDAIEDPDCDGLINLHEYMAGCNVWVSDGIGTALYAFCHAIDDRILGGGILPMEVYLDSNSLPYPSVNIDGLPPTEPVRAQYFVGVISGDSGNPKFFVCGDTAILTCALYGFGTGSSGVGPFVTYYRKRIQSVMDELCPGYALGVFDLSTFRRLDDED